jgi:hypothetical protein
MCPQYEVELALNRMEKQLKDVVWRAEPHELHVDMNTIQGVPATLAQVGEQAAELERLLALNATTRPRLWQATLQVSLG